jgi:hypothetical protein
MLSSPISKRIFVIITTDSGVLPLQRAHLPGSFGHFVCLKSLSFRLLTLLMRTLTPHIRLEEVPYYCS